LLLLEKAGTGTEELLLKDETTVVEREGGEFVVEMIKRMKKRKKG